MRTVNETARRAKQIQIMQACFNCYMEKGFGDIGIKGIADSCGINPSSIYQYFENLDDLIVKSTEYCMSLVEAEFMKKVPKKAEDMEKFIDEIAYWSAEKHGKKYRLMYQVYTHPKYIEYGKKFFEGVNGRYAQYAEQLAPIVGIEKETVVALIFIIIRAVVHYALFEDEFYLKAQTNFVKQSLKMVQGK